ncbi:imidazolonepropionase-like amidohydrolase [Kordia periserrulae]|uniref:Imidazolonepropionase-like amidohydrolase n=1 Tax=Kordia periserrulae TaxID=701523 RepID=A0A2T6C0X4_9FLAO|nr:amidohydrolase family protein [Kordia periserrulae]PTX61970.1 imidazolonepropionase-like amidohydrolase [Kordia periserrulae]
MKKYIYIYVLCVTVLFGTFGYAQQTPAPKQSEAISIVGATAHIGNGKVIDNATIVFENGKIIRIGSAASTRTSGKRIDAKGKHVYPGFISPNSTLGLVEIDAVRATRDQDETGAFNPHIRSLIAYNAESKVVESCRPNGILIAQITPRGGRVSGTSSIVQLDAWNWEDAAVKVDDAIHINWPNNFTIGRWWLGEERGLRPNKNYPEQVQQIQDVFNESKSYLNGSRSPKNLPYEAMNGLMNGTQKLFVHVDTEKGILDAINFGKKNNVKIVIVGGYQAHKVASTLRQNNVPVLLHRTHYVPEMDDEDYDLSYKKAKILTDAGVLVGLENSGQMERMNTRNLPFLAGTAAAHGLDKEKALQLITSNTAKILGIDAQLGTLEVGKDATLFISEGDALDMRGNILTHAFINGRELSLETHQTELWKRYMKKYEGK